MPAGTNCKLPGQSNIVLLIINWLQCSSFTDLQNIKHNNACENSNKHRDPKQIWSVTKCNSGQRKIALLIKNWLRVNCWLQFWERNYVSRPHEKMMAFKPTRQTSMGSLHIWSLSIVEYTLRCYWGNFSKSGCGPLSSCLQTTVVRDISCSATSPLSSILCPITSCRP